MELVMCPLCGAEITTRQREELNKKHEAQIHDTVRRKVAEREREVAERAVGEIRVQLQASELRVKQSEQREVAMLAREQELAGRERLHSALECVHGNRKPVDGLDLLSVRRKGGRGIALRR